MNPQDFTPIVNGLIVGLLSGAFGSWIGIRVGQAKMEVHLEHVKKRLDDHIVVSEGHWETLRKRSHTHNERLLIHDIEIEDAFAKLALPRKRRENWRLE